MSTRPAIAWPVLLFLAATLVWVALAGKDTGWDLINHQLYLPELLFHWRFDRDLYAAGPQAYQFPLGYVPLWAAVKLGLPGILIGILLTLVHASVVWPLSRLVRLLMPSAGPEQAVDTRRWHALGLAAAFVCPVYLFTVGSASIDPFGTLFILLGLARLLEASAAATGATTADARVSALWFGLAAALKPSSAIFATAAGALWLLLWLTGRARARHFAVFCACAIAVVLLCYGPWAALMWVKFGNPLMPLFNQVFGSPLAPADNILALRFLPLAKLDYLTRPLYMATYRSYVVTEGFQPDARPLALLLAAAASGLLWLVRGKVRAAWPLWRERLLAPTTLVVLFMLLVYVQWMGSSGNGRYAIALFLLVGVMLVRTMRAILPGAVGRMLLLGLLVVNLGVYVLDGDRRYNAEPWSTGPFVQFLVPDKLRNEPQLHLSIGSQTSAALALAMAPGGAFMNIVGNLSLPTDGALGAEVNKRLQHWQGRTRVLFRAGDRPDQVKGRARIRVDELLARFGLQTDWTDCLAMVIVTRPDVQLRPPESLDPGLRQALSCAVHAGPGESADRRAERARADRIFARIEAACPRIYGPRPFVSEFASGIWQRKYLNSDVLLTLTWDTGVLQQESRNVPTNFLGTVAELESGGGDLTCPSITVMTPQ